MDRQCKLNFPHNKVNNYLSQAMFAMHLLSNVVRCRILDSMPTTMQMACRRSIMAVKLPTCRTTVNNNLWILTRFSDETLLLSTRIHSRGASYINPKLVARK